ncbi:MAG: IclR family transcriptional regulator [Pseudotabrizicola sp.]|uniref:IclR family transcriptional regulator n=1 Tax=Pseudotabrizicola sp. TaxID=2939647 RepID=UPI002731EE1E|nr:IclR family transcriptional regulator [Pseudotabrizicola sp.]MDP2082098.1 IclR family transcriptional regulator [Pseudotabrizicola sp.]MDZ7576491.1 IclR family transcriptional regulator [Pseudotabrizicola sp.]
MGSEGHSDGTVGKALDVLDMVSSHGHPVRFSDLLEKSPYPKATLYRFLQTLTHQGMLAYDTDRGTYSLGVRLVRLAHTAWTQSSLAPLARPFISDLAAQTGETVHLAQMDQGQVLYVDKRNAAKPVEMFSQAGKVGPAYCTGVGKAMLAFMSDDAVEAAISRQSFHRFTDHTLDTPGKLRAELAAIRTLGYAFDREEHEPGIICCAAPILARSGKVMGALSVTSTTARSSLATLEAEATRITDCATQIAAEAENWRFPDQN